MKRRLQPMRAIFVFLISFLVLTAQEQPSFDDFKKQYLVIKEEVSKAKDLTSPEITEKWISELSQKLYKLREVSVQLSTSSDPSVKEAVKNLPIDSLMNDIKFISQRYEAEDGVKNWTLTDFRSRLESITQFFKRIEDNPKLLFEHDVMMFSLQVYHLEVLKKVAENSEFWARVCGGPTELDCLASVKAVNIDVASKLEKATGWWIKVAERKKP